jgi:hypothetical protein
MWVMRYEGGVAELSRRILPLVGMICNINTQRFLNYDAAETIRRESSIAEFIGDVLGR